VSAGRWRLAAALLVVVVAAVAIGIGAQVLGPGSPSPSDFGTSEASVAPTGASSPEGTPPPSSSPRPTAAPEPFAASVVFETRVSDIPRSVDDRAWEPGVATHPTDPDRVAVIYQHHGPGAPCSLNPTIRISHDAGRTWRTTRASPAAGSGRGVSLHAVIAWGPGPDGGSRLYWANMTTPACGDGRFSLTTTFSDDEGDSWAALTVEQRAPPWVGGFPDITVDRDQSSPGYGTVYVGYNWLDPAARGPGFGLLASADFGVTWSRVEIPPAAAPADFEDWWRIGYRLRTAPDGALFASWYQADLKKWDRENILAKGGAANVGRLGVAVARIEFDRETGTFELGPSRVAVTVAESAYSTSGRSAPGTDGNIRPDPMWQHGLDIDPGTGSVYVAVGEFGPSSGDEPRGSIRVARSDDGGKTWLVSDVPVLAPLDGRRQSSFKPNLIASGGAIVVTFHTLDDVESGATVGSAFAASRDGGGTWLRAMPISAERWLAANIGGATNGIGLRERADRTAGGDVFWAFGDGRHAQGSAAGRIAVYGTLIDLSGERRQGPVPVDRHQGR
jgi:hypothetical protein